MKKIVSIIMITLIGLTIIPKTLTNGRHTVLEGTTSVYTKEEVDSLLSAIRTNITNNTNELTIIKSELTALQNSLKDYALKSSLNTTNSNIDNLNTFVTNNTARIESLEALGNNTKIKYGKYIPLQATNNQEIECGFKPVYIQLTIMRNGGMYSINVYDERISSEVMSSNANASLGLPTTISDAIYDTGFRVNQGYGYDGWEYYYVALGEISE